MALINAIIQIINQNWRKEKVIMKRKTVFKIVILNELIFSMNLMSTIYLHTSKYGINKALNIFNKMRN